MTYGVCRPPLLSAGLQQCAGMALDEAFATCLLPKKLCNVHVVENVARSPRFPRSLLTLRRFSCTFGLKCSLRILREFIENSEN